ncbi:MAG: hypothetical protein WCL51_03890 [Bacteroidota bacterium]
MNERQLTIKFILYLNEKKGYPKESLLSEIAILTRSNQRFFVDLALLDLASNEYIGIIEFKNRIDSKLELLSREQVLQYRDALGTPTIPLFLVISKGEDSFEVFRLENDEIWVPILLDDFPAYQTLSSQIKAEEKLKKEQREIIHQNKKQLFSYWIFSSVILGILATLFSVFFLQKEFRKKGNAVIVTNNCCDSLQNKINELDKRISSIEKDSFSISTIDTTIVFKDINDRIRNLEFSISSDPEKVLHRLEIQNKLYEINNEVKHLKEIKDLNIQSIDSRISIIFSIIIGIFLALISTLLGLVVAFGKK